MPQTLLSLLALALAALMTLNIKDASRGTYSDQIHDELQMAAAAVALQVMETAEERPFDQRTTVTGIRAASNYLPVSGGPEYSRWDTFGGTTCDLDALWTTAACDDLDDLSGISRQMVPFELRDGRHPTSGARVPRSLPMDVSVHVEYVLDEAPELESALPTDHKRVIVTVHLNAGVSTSRDRNEPLARLERVVSYDARKASHDFERETGETPHALSSN